MISQLITKETAILAKEKGFPYLSYIQAYYIEDELIFEYESEHEYINGVKHCWEDKLIPIYPALQQSLLQKWLREEHNIHIEIELASDEECWIIQPYIYQWNFYKDGNITIDREFYNSYEEALEEALQKALKLI